MLKIGIFSPLSPSKSTIHAACGSVPASATGSEKIQSSHSPSSVTCSTDRPRRPCAGFEPQACRSVSPAAIKETTTQARSSFWHTEARLIFEMLHYTLLRLDDAHSTVDRLPGHERGAGSCRPRGEHSNDQHSLISIRTDHTPSGEICCTIEDSGPGIDRSHLSHLFENTFTTKKTGMGMGLIISRSIIEAHDGCIRAENNPARFRTVLPQGKGYAASNTPVRRLQHTSRRPHPGPCGPNRDLGTAFEALPDRRQKQQTRPSTPGIAGVGLQNFSEVGFAQVFELPVCLTGGCQQENVIPYLFPGIEAHGRVH